MDFVNNLAAVYTGNIIGIVLVVILFCGNYWRMRQRSSENACLMVLLLLTFISCVIDPLVFTVDGNNAMWAVVVSYVGNSWLFISNMLVGYYWVCFVCHRIFGFVPFWQKLIMQLTLLVSFLIVILNVFVPVCFTIDSNNVYSRGFMYYVFLAIAFGFLVDSIVVYIIGWKKGGIFNFFPVWLYMAPIVAGALIQSLFYGLSILWACFAVAIAGVLSGLQNESIYKDALTGIFNRAYLDYIQKKIGGSKNAKVSGIMMDLNGFKNINDNFGHSVGDDALKTTAKIMLKAVGSLGTVIRYAGDEFVVFINTTDENVVKSCIDKIQKGMEKFNDSKKAPFQLSVSYGYCVLDPSYHSMNDFMNKIDKEMYNNKKAYYESGNCVERRR